MPVPEGLRALEHDVLGASELGVVAVAEVDSQVLLALHLAPPTGCCDAVAAVAAAAATAAGSVGGGVAAVVVSVVVGDGVDVVGGVCGGVWDRPELVAEQAEQSEVHVQLTPVVSAAEVLLCACVCIGVCVNARVCK